MTKKTVWTMQHALLAALCLFATTSLHATASFAQEHSVVMTGDAVDADIRA